MKFPPIRAEYLNGPMRVHHSGKGLADDDPVKMELLQALHHHLTILKESVKDNMKQTLLSSVIAEDFQDKSEYEADKKI